MTVRQGGWWCCCFVAFGLARDVLGMVTTNWPEAPEFHPLYLVPATLLMGLAILCGDIALDIHDEERAA